MPAGQARKRAKKRGAKKAPASLKKRRKSAAPAASPPVAPKNSGKSTKRRAASVAVLLVIIFLLISPFLHHFLIFPIRLNVAVVDKTVGENYREHYGLFWTLNHNNVLPSRSGPGTADPDGDGQYAYTTDYYGFHPASNLTTSIMDINLDPSIVDVLYLADTYGASDTYGVAAKQGNYAAGIKAPEAAAIAQFAGRGGSIYAEWNVLGDPTYSDAVAESTMSRVLHTTYVGYGSYFGNMSSTNQVVKDMYNKATGHAWDFIGPGIVIVLDAPSYLHTKVIVLNGNDLSDEQPLIKMESAAPSQITKGVAWGGNFGYWFEIVKPYSDVQTLATFRLHTTQSGSAKLAAYGLDTTFPALFQYDGPYKVLYCAADCTDYPGVYPPYAWARVSGVELLFENYPQSWPLGEQMPMHAFFWRVLYPIITNGLGWLGAHGKTEATSFIDPFSGGFFMAGLMAHRRRTA